MTRTPDDARPADADVGQPGDERSLADAGLPQEGETAGSGTPGRARFSGLGHRLYNGEAGLDVVGHSRLIYRITAVVLLLCLLSMVFRGFNFGIDF
jgi:preprotein translocase subunit SecF